MENWKLREAFEIKVENPFFPITNPQLLLIDLRF